MKKRNYNYTYNSTSITFNYIGLKIRIILTVLFLSSILSITTNSLLAKNLDGSPEYSNNDNVLFSISNSTLYCKTLSNIQSNDIFYQPAISNLSCPSGNFSEILCREDKKFNKKDYIILSCVPDTTFTIEVLDPRIEEFSTCTIMKQYFLVSPTHKIPPRSIKCSYIDRSTFKESSYYLDEAFYVNRVRDY